MTYQMNHSTQPGPITLADILRACTRHWLGLALILVICYSMDGLLIVTQKPVYRAQTEILLEGRSSAAGPSDPLDAVSLPNTGADVGSQIEILQSPAVLIEAMQQAGLPVPQGDDTDLADNSNLPDVKVDEVELTNAATISVDSPDPNIAKKVADALPQVYARDQSASKEQEIDKALDFLNGQRIGEENELSKAQAALEQYKHKRTLTPLEQEGALRSQRFSLAQAELVRAQATTAAAAKTLELLEAERSTTPDSILVPDSQSNAPAIESQKQLISELKVQRAALLPIYRENSSKVVQIDTQIAEAEARLRAIPKSIDMRSTQKNPATFDLDMRIVQARSELSAARANQSKLEADAAAAKGELERYNQISPNQEVLERAVIEHQETLAGIARDVEALRIRRNETHDPVSVLSQSGTPKRVRPRPTLYTALATFVGLFLGVFYALAREASNDRIESLDGVYDLGGLPALGTVSSLPRGAALLSRNGSESPVLDGYRVVRFNLLFATLENPAKSIVVTSSGPSEGKTEFACNLAVAASGEGRRVILVDGNLRHPTIHKLMNVAGKPGLAEVALGESDLASALHTTSIPGLRVLTAGGTFSPQGNSLASPSHEASLPTGIRGDSASILASAAMKSVYQELLEDSDLVIFDSPSCMGNADALVLGNLADSTILLAKEGVTRKQSLGAGLAALQQARAHVIGVALTTRAKGRKAHA